MLIEAPGRLGNSPWVEGKFSLGDIKPERDVVVVEAAARADSVIYRIKTKRSELEAAGADPELQVRARVHPLDLSVVGLGAALPALDACSSELLMKWGYSKELQHRLTSYPRPKRQLSTYASSSDYPPAAVRAGAMGEAHVLVSIGTNGRASNCRIIRSSAHPDIDDDLQDRYGASRLRASHDVRWCPGGRASLSDNALGTSAVMKGLAALLGSATAVRR
ncbi:MAG: TonB family protein [Sphingomonas sp.]|nr:TonB family protein [Sphingomonas sp.]